MLHGIGQDNESYHMGVANIYKSMILVCMMFMGFRIVLLFCYDVSVYTHTHTDKLI